VADRPGVSVVRTFGADRGADWTSTGLGLSHACARSFINVSSGVQSRGLVDRVAKIDLPSIMKPALGNLEMLIIAFAGDAIDKTILSGNPTRPPACQ
jgi:hypothetical protein